MHLGQQNHDLGINCVQKPPLNILVDICSGASSLNFGLSLQLHLYFVYGVGEVLTSLCIYTDCPPVRKGPAGIQVYLNTWNLKKNTGGFFSPSHEMEYRWKAIYSNKMR